MSELEANSDSSSAVDARAGEAKPDTASETSASVPKAEETSAAHSAEGDAAATPATDGSKPANIVLIRPHERRRKPLRKPKPTPNADQMASRRSRASSRLQRSQPPSARCRAHWRTLVSLTCCSRNTRSRQRR